MPYQLQLAPDWQVADFESLPTIPLNTGSGRGAVHLIDHPKAQIVARQYRHGGARRRILPRSFAVTSRAEREYAMHRCAWEAGLPTVEPVGWSVRRAGILPKMRFYYFYSCYQPQATPLPQAIKQTPLRTAQLVQMAAILRRLYTLNIFHTDLNLNNWLLEDDRILLIDFDKAEHFSGDPANFLQACLLRMARSAKKLKLLEKRVSVLRFLILSARAFELDPRKLAENLPKRFFRERFWDKCRWKLSGGHQG